MPHSPPSLVGAPRWPLLAGLASLALLAAAHGFERFAGLEPCALCLHQREAHWVTTFVGLLGFGALVMRPHREAASALSFLLAAGFLAGAAIAGFHAGVELKWWPGLPECGIGGGGALDTTDLLASLSGPQRIVRCDEVPWAFAGISMAGWNMLASLALGAVSLAAAFNGGRLPRLPGGGSGNGPSTQPVRREPQGGASLGGGSMA
jgi:disulfide bond formation protein DsbB